MTRLWRDFRPQIIVTVALLILWGVFFVANPSSFGSPYLYRSFMSTIPVTAVLALGLTLLVVAGEMDLSFPAVSATAAWVFALAIARLGWPPELAFGAALAAGLVMGVVNGLLVVSVGIPSIIATIGTQFVWRGLVLLLSDGLALPLSAFRDSTVFTLFVGRIGSWQLPVQTFWALGLALFLAFVLNRHPFGDALRFIGDNKGAAMMMGVPVNRVRIGAYGLMGVLAAFAGLLSTMELGNWWPIQGEGYMLLVFAAVFVGGTSAYGGEGTMYGTLVGSVIIGIIEAGIVAAGLVGFWTRFVHGLVIVGAVTSYTLLARGRDNRRTARSSS